jgi:hypothetical protein
MGKNAKEWNSTQHNKALFPTSIQCEKEEAH